MRRALLLATALLVLGCTGGRQGQSPRVDGSAAGGGGHSSPPDAAVEAGAGTSGAAGSGAAGTVSSPFDAAAATDTNASPPDASGGAVAPVQFYGRWDFTGGKAVTVYSGSHVTARFQGTGVSARLDLSRSQNPVTTVTWQVDGGEWKEGDVKATMQLATGLPPGQHDVVFMARGMEELQNRWNPPVIAALSFVGFEVEGGALVPTARPNRTRIEFLGDSLTEGVRVVMNNASDPWHTNGRLAYPCLVSLALGAEWRQVGFGHQGILQDGHGNVPKAADSFDWVYATVPRDVAWVADVVVVNRERTTAALRRRRSRRSSRATSVSSVPAIPSRRSSSCDPSAGIARRR